MQLKCIEYSMEIRWSDEDQAYLVTLPEFGDCITHGSTYEEAAKNGREVLELLVENCEEEQKSLPEPRKHQSAKRVADAIVV